MDSTHQPFWKDDPEISAWNFFSARTRQPYFAYFSTAVRIIIFAVGLLVFYKSPILIAVWTLAVGLPIAARIYILRKTKDKVQDMGESQSLARQRIGASHIGSAIHVAGHPLLQRDQPVVLAIVGDQLNLYSYESPIPLDTIRLNDVQSLHTVSYDEDRVPHIEAIDSAAQALQIRFLWREQPCVCLFRRMRKMKAIDWYHALQQTRLQAGTAK